MKLLIHNLKLATFLIFIAIALGAFGAHGLEKTISAKALATFKTGNFYHIIHSLALMLIALIEFQIKGLSLLKTKYCILIGLTLFSGCCYLYAVTGIKLFALIVPLGGISFLLAWLLLFTDLKKINHS